jgi:hypothetical protein
MGQLDRTKAFWGHLLNSDHEGVDLMVIDNAPHTGEGQLAFFSRFIEPYWRGSFQYRTAGDNMGLINSMQYAYKESDHDIIIYMHNDLFLYDRDWVGRIKYVFENQQNCGLVGVFGAKGCSNDGGRFECYSNMLEAEIHSHRMLVTQCEEVTVLDGMLMAASRVMLDAGDGVDTNYTIHHFYDKDLSLESIKRGFNNYVVGIPVHHESGITANAELFNKWADKHFGDDGQMTIYRKNEQRFIEKWKSTLPMRVF